MPKSLTEDTGVSSWSRKATLMSDILLRSCLVPKKMSLVCLDLSVIGVSRTPIGVKELFSLSCATACEGKVPFLSKFCD